jgi:hypothetical protein
MTHATVARGFDRWYSQAKSFLNQRRVLEKILLRMCNAKVAAALDQWKDNVKELIEMRVKGSKVLLRWSKMGM